MDLTELSKGLQVLVDKSTLFGDSPLEVAVIANLKAGGFTRPQRAIAAMKQLELSVSSVADKPSRKGSTMWRTCVTEKPRHASKMAASFIEEATVKTEPLWLIITATGDGTSYEFLDELSRAPKEIRDRFTILRLPMGTGNDSSDGRELSDTFSRLTGNGKIELQSVVRVIPRKGSAASLRAPNGEWRSFNIASMGLDAFVTHMTNKMKSAMPGDSYKLWLDLASVFYEKFYPPSKNMVITVRDGDKEIGKVDGAFLLAAMGCSGHRTYGSNQMILQSDDNFIAVDKANLFKKLAFQKALKTMTIGTFKEAHIYPASEVEISYDSKILVQMDGEAEPLTKDDFPVKMIRTEPMIKHIAHI